MVSTTKSNVGSRNGSLIKAKVQFGAVDLLWVLGFIVILTLSIGTTVLIFDFLKSLGIFHNYIVYSLCIYFFINIYILVTGLMCRICIPSMKEGNLERVLNSFSYGDLIGIFIPMYFSFFVDIFFITEQSGICF